MDKCPYCGAETREGDNFCLNCGNRLVSTPVSGQAQEVGNNTQASPEEWNAVQDHGVTAASATADAWPAGQSANERLQVGRFLLASLLGFLINTMWLWLLVKVLHLSPLAPVPLMMLATPWISFLLNRHWVFKAA